MHGPLTLSMKQLDRLQVLTRIAERRLTRRRAAGLLQIGERQVRRLYRAFVQDGAAGLVSRRRDRPSARRLPAATQERALALIRERYADFGPTFAHQKLTEEHALVLSVETLRGWMSAASSMAASTPGSRTVARAARCWSTSTTPPAASWSSASRTPGPRSITSTPPGATSSVTASPWRSTATGSASFTSRPAIAPRVALAPRSRCASGIRKG